MFRVTKLSGKWYGYEMGPSRYMDREEIENMFEMVEQAGDVIMLCEDLSDLEEYGVDPEEVIMVSKDDET
jgi:hypothetical protein